MARKGPGTPRLRPLAKKPAPTRRVRRARILRERRIAVGTLVGCIGLLSLWLACRLSAPVASPGVTTTSSAARAATPAEAAVAVPPIPTVTAPDGGATGRERLAARIDALLAERQGRYSVVVATPDAGTIYSRRAQAVVEAASLYKLAIMVEVYRQREAGWLDFDEAITLTPAFFLEAAGERFAIGDDTPIGELLEAMVVDSSNVAAAALLGRVGNGNVNATMAELGLYSTEIRWMPAAGDGSRAGGWRAEETPADGVYNVTSAADMALLFRGLLVGEIVSADASAGMLRLLVRQRINDRLPALLPESTIVAHKTGNLPGIVHDAGVIYTPGGATVVAVLTEGADDREATEFIAQLGALVYDGTR